MFGRHKRKSTNIVFVTFRLILSVLMFAVLLGGIYSAYKHFSGLDPLKMDPQSIAVNLLRSKTPQDVLTYFSSIKLTQGLAKQVNDKVLTEIKVIPKDLDVVKTVSPKVVLRFLMVADSHSDNKNLAKALSQGQIKYPEIKFILGLGDYTEVGTVKELIAAKAEFDLSTLRYFLIPGDHDLWDSRNKGLDPLSNFRQTFGPSYQSFSQDGFHFILLDNSDNYHGFSDAQLEWLDDTLEKVKKEGDKGIFVFVHEPLYHPSSDHTMGAVEPNLKKQAKSLIFNLKSAEVKEILAGDIHFFSKYTEPDTAIPMVTIGAVTSDRNVQSPRYALGTIFDDGSLGIEDVEIK